ncbi:hypothetical protein Q0Z83_060590 [Actinoplanes sichuanensis]|uniref:ATP-grasp target RiPP n=1 Tax=Actinoplanes sichuanensis TaxID=512349 RepID=A0ABW4A5Y0_9ACTN|nr:hypothetical protein [Actinoplanes sichuanensis]BEL07868.1 hypothetical protein Q0Z83_060590 [Actinoplanes sichuanensis]
MSNSEINFDRDAHEITRPDGGRFIAKDDVTSYELNPAYKVTPVRGHDDPKGRGFIVTNRDDQR